MHKFPSFTCLAHPTFSRQAALFGSYNGSNTSWNIWVLLLHLLSSCFVLLFGHRIPFYHFSKLFITYQSLYNFIYLCFEIIMLCMYIYRESARCCVCFLKLISVTQASGVLVLSVEVLVRWCLNLMFLGFLKSCFLKLYFFYLKFIFLNFF